MYSLSFLLRLGRGILLGSVALASEPLVAIATAFEVELLELKSKRLLSRSSSESISMA
jgi:hypothetical protein